MIFWGKNDNIYFAIDTMNYTVICDNSLVWNKFKCINCNGTLRKILLKNLINKHTEWSPSIICISRINTLFSIN